MSSGILAPLDQLPDRFIETEFGPIPDGWTHVPIGNLVGAIRGGTPSTKNPDFWEGGENTFCTPKDLSRLLSPVLLDTERMSKNLLIMKTQRTAVL